jgi:hypothetical protein
MALTPLERAENDLAKYYSLVRREDFAQSVATESVSSEGSTTVSINQELGRLILDVTEGGYTTATMIEKIRELTTSDEDAEAEVEKLLSIFYEWDEDVPCVSKTRLSEIIGTGVNLTPRSPTKTSTSLSAICSRSVRITPAGRHTNAIALFLNAIPTIELSRCVPFLDVQFYLARPAIDSSTGRLAALSLVKFLNGAAAVSEGTTDYMLATATSATQEEIDLAKEQDRSLHVAGMELFTTPQTLVNADIASDASLRSADVIDRFRPFLSLKELKIDIAPSNGIMSFKTAELQMILHDRSRLAEIADLVRPDLYGQTELMIEYGWSHPDRSGDGTNAYAAIMNAMRVREKFGISNCSFSFDHVGQVAVTLKLFTKGSAETLITAISKGEGVEEVMETVRQISEAINAIREDIFRQDVTGTAEVRGTQILSAASDVSTATGISDDLKKELAEFRAAQSSSTDPDTQNLLARLEELYGTDGTDGVVGELQNTIASSIQTKLDLIRGTETSDPFLDLAKSSLDGVMTGDTGYVSLAKLLLVFAGKPLVETNKFDDIQFIFYPFNTGAGAARDMSAAEFLVPLGDFNEKFTQLTTSRNSANIPVRDFIMWLANNFIDEIASINYGLSDLYELSTPDTETGATPTYKAKEAFADPTALNNEITARMEAVGCPDGVFKIPIIDLIIECVPVTTDILNTESGVTQSGTVLRIHVFDKNTTSYESQASLLAASRNDFIGTVGSSATNATEDPNEHAAAFNETLQQAIDEGLLEAIYPEGENTEVVYRVAGGPTKLKEFISRTMPTLVYGTNFTAIKNANLRTMQNPQLATVNMLRAGTGNALTPQGNGADGLPLQMIPTELDVDVFGCPLLNFAQQFFIDFSTGTTIDNVYAITGLNHVITQGKFNSSIKFTNLDAYGKYRSLLSTVGAALTEISAAQPST